MEIWKNVQKRLPKWWSSTTKPTTNLNPEHDGEPVGSGSTDAKVGERHLELATESLRKLFEDARIPDSVRAQLQAEYDQVKTMLDKLENGHLHIAVFGRVSVGKSSLLNALLGKEVFSVSVIHGETKEVNMNEWDEYEDDGIYLLDTPGINEVDGEERERLAIDVAERADMVLFVIDSDLTEVEYRALHQVASVHRPLLLVMNKADRYNEQERKQLRSLLRSRTQGIVPSENIVFTTAQSRSQTILMVDEQGNEKETVRHRPADVSALKTRLWDIIESDGKTLSALNASLFASNLSNNVAERILEVKRDIGQRTIHLYCLAKGVTVAVNPVPVADLFAAAAVDASMVYHLSRLYGLPMTWSESRELISTVFTQLTILMGVTWAINLASSALKLTTVGLSTLITATTQGAVAWYGTLVVGRVAERWLANGKSWGDAGPKLAVQQILDSLDRDSVMNEAREEILSYLRNRLKG